MTMRWVKFSFSGRMDVFNYGALNSEVQIRRMKSVTSSTLRYYAMETFPLLRRFISYWIATLSWCGCVCFGVPLWPCWMFVDVSSRAFPPATLKWQLLNYRITGILTVHSVWEWCDFVSFFEFQFFHFQLVVALYF